MTRTCPRYARCKPRFEEAGLMMPSRAVIGAFLALVLIPTAGNSEPQLRGDSHLTLVCHQFGTAAQKELQLPFPAAEAHLRAHADLVGPCNVSIQAHIGPDGGTLALSNTVSVEFGVSAFPTGQTVLLSVTRDQTVDAEYRLAG